VVDGERIWVDDLVRPKVLRRDLVPNGSEIEGVTRGTPFPGCIQYPIRKCIEPELASSTSDVEMDEE
jgi:hypothetical protein